MNERIINLFGALSGLLLVIFVFMPPSTPNTSSLPTTEDQNGSGLYAVHGWLEHSAIEPMSLRRRYSELLTMSKGEFDGSISADGNLLVVTWPLLKQVNSEEFENLKQWLAKGNQMLVMAAVTDHPAWAAFRTVGLQSALISLGLAVPQEEGQAEAAAEDDSEQQQTEPASETAQGDLSDIGEQLRQLMVEKVYLPTFEHDLFSGVQQISLTNPIPHFEFEFNDPDARVLPLLQDRESSQVLAWHLSSPEVPNGFFLFGHSGLFSNEQISKQNQQRLFANLVSLFVKPGGTVIFDDFHQGLSDLYDAAAFFSDPRFWRTVFSLLLLWLIYMVFYAVRFGPVITDNYGIDSSAFSRRFGSLLVRHADTATINQQLIKAFNNTYRRQHDLVLNGEAVSKYVRMDHRFQAAEIIELQTLYSSISDNERISPRFLQQKLARLYAHL